MSWRTDRFASAATGLAVALALAMAGCSGEFESSAPPPQPPCHPAELEDDFSGTELGLLWTQSGPADAVGVADGRAFIDLSANEALQNRGIVSDRQYNMTGCSLWVEVPKVPAAEVPAGVVMMAAFDTAHVAIIEVVKGELLVGLAIDDNFEAGSHASYDPVAHRWWRIRHDTGNIYFETAPDAQQWATMLKTTSPADPTAITVALTAQTGEAYPEAARVEFDNLDLLP